MTNRQATTQPPASAPDKTQQSEPSDTDILALARHHLADKRTNNMVAFARALLSRYGQAPAASAKPRCWCETCRPITMDDMRMVVCPTCGNKRCPRATDHRNACTGSNEPGQNGSSYERCTAPVAAQAPAAVGDAREVDPLQGAANWLVQAHGRPSPTVLCRCLMIGYNRAQRLYDAALVAQQGEGGGA